MQFNFPIHVIESSLPLSLASLVSCVCLCECVFKSILSAIHRHKVYYNQKSWHFLVSIPTLLRLQSPFDAVQKSQVEQFRYKMVRYDILNPISQYRAAKPRPLQYTIRYCVGMSCLNRPNGVSIASECVKSIRLKYIICTIATIEKSSFSFHEREGWWWWCTTYNSIVETVLSGGFLCARWFLLLFSCNV